MGVGRTAGHQVAVVILQEAATPAGTPVMGVAVTTLMDQVVDGHQTMDVGLTAGDPTLAAVAALEAEGAQVALGTLGDLMVREGVTRTRVTTADVGEVALTPVSRRS